MPEKKKYYEWVNTLPAASDAEISAGVVPIDVGDSTKKYTPITATQLNTHVNNTLNPHSVTKAQVGLGNVDNTSDANKSISTATQNALNAIIENKMDKTDNPSLGRFISLSALQAAYPTSTYGKYAIVDSGIGAYAEQYIYDEQDGWVKSVTTALPITSTDDLPEGTIHKYATNSRTISALLTDFVTSAGITSSDSVFSAIQKLADKFSDYVTSSSLSTTLLSYVTSSSLSTTLTSYLSKLSSTTDNTIVRYDGTAGSQQTSNVTIDDNNGLYGYTPVVVEKTANYTLLASDTGKVISFNSASDLTCTLPVSTTANFGCMILRRGTGNVTFVNNSNTVVIETGHTKIAAQAGAVNICYLAAGVVSIAGRTA